MTYRVLEIADLPANVEVRASVRRRRTVTAYREAGRTILLVPERMSRRAILAYATELVARLDARELRDVVTDAELSDRADRLAAAYLDGSVRPSSVRWVSNQRHRWGSCTPLDGTIRLSDRLLTMPRYVQDAVLFHELCHLVVADHGREFAALESRIPQLESARAFLAGYELAGSVEFPGAGAPELPDGTC